MDNEALEAIYGGMTEAVFTANVRRAAVTAGWLYYHTYDSRRSDPGMLDCIMVRGDRILWRELKTQKGKVSPAQIAWIDALKATGADVDVWRPFDWGTGTIMKELE